MWERCSSYVAADIRFTYMLTQSWVSQLNCQINELAGRVKESVVSIDYPVQIACSHLLAPEMPLGILMRNCPKKVSF